ncbi:AI-2E family transporter [Flavobacterium psychrotolerans]|uniref:AI-2E family transporter n=1 Tax=Flavobacterium psychrotolerans TaxID=2169410 RepID=A0A2U1JI19_9FLAO|nr:AI-2E family transporter [Flavobacterium psychrotolerans]PWA04781.1 AI-2E family transporter [Flavobacterium psychrotolerans]
MNDIAKLPFYVKLCFTLLSLIGLTFIVYIGKDILTPIMMAFLFAILLRPVALFFKTKLRFPHVIAVMVSVILFVILIVGIFMFISFQISDIASDFDKIERNINIHVVNIEQFIKENFNLSTREQRRYLNDATDNSMQTGKAMIGSTIVSFTDMILNLTLIPIYTFLILLYRTHFILFLSKLFKEKQQHVLQDILYQIKVAVNSYIIGLIIEMIAVSVLTTIGLTFIGVQYAILLGIITGILNLIPYIGILFAGFLTIVASLSGTPDLSIIIGVIVVNVVVQLIDNNVLVPLIVNSKVEINAFVSIVGIIIGGSIAGISGMFLAIPIIAVLKVIFDRINGLEPWGYLMGDDLPKTYKWHKIKFPLYDFENSSHSTTVTANIPTPVFTETQSSKAETDSFTGN